MTTYSNETNRGTKKSWVTTIIIAGISGGIMGYLLEISGIENKGGFQLLIKGMLGAVLNLTLLSIVSAITAKKAYHRAQKTKNNEFISHNFAALKGAFFGGVFGV